MKVVILAGGRGTRISEESTIRPKPMIEIGGRPILWHIMKTYSHHGYNDFLILLGYRGYDIKEFFANYWLRNSDVMFDVRNNEMTICSTNTEEWRVTLAETGEETMTGGRIKRAAKYLLDDELFMLTYGDGVADVNISKLVQFHHSHDGMATVTAIQPAGRFGVLDIDDQGRVASFREKPNGEGSWINGGFFVCNKKVLEYLDGDETVFEREPLETISKMKQLHTFHHDGFWHCMDTLRDKINLNEMWDSGKAPWKVWE